MPRPSALKNHQHQVITHDGDTENSPLHNSEAEEDPTPGIPPTGFSSERDTPIKPFVLFYWRSFPHFLIYVGHASLGGVWCPGCSVATWERWKEQVNAMVQF